MNGGTIWRTRFRLLGDLIGNRRIRPSALTRTESDLPIMPEKGLF